MNATTQDTAFYLPTNTTLHRLVEAAKTAAHDDAETCKRIHRGAALVEAGAVEFTDGRCTVKSGNALYPVNGRCPCPDMARRGTPCKHLYAKWLAIRLAEETTMEAQEVRSLQFIASLDDGDTQVHGIATAFEDGRMFFREYDTEVDRELSPEEICYKMILGRKIP